MKKIFLLIVAVCSLVQATQGQTKTKNSDNGYAIEAVDKSYGEYYAFHSDTMNRDFPLLVFVPEGYKYNKSEYNVVYMLHGMNDAAMTEDGIRSMNNKKTGIKEAATAYNVIIVCPLVGNKFYLNSPLIKNDKYASLIGVELVKFVEKNYRVIKDRKNRILAGFSMGGYGAVSLLCRYPDTFSVAVSRGGALDSKSLIEDLHWDDALTDVLGNYWHNQELHHLNSCLNLLNRVRNRKDVAFVLEVGREDFLYKSNKKVEAKLKENNLPFIFAEYPGGHVWDKNCLNTMLTHLQYFVPTKK